MELSEAKEILKNESKYNESLNKTTNELLENENLHYKNEPYVSNFEIDIHRRTKVNQAIDTVLKALHEDELIIDRVKNIKDRLAYDITYNWDNALDDLRRMLGV